MCILCVCQLAQNYFIQAADAGNANAMAFLGKVTLVTRLFVCSIIISWAQAMSDICVSVV